MKFIALEKEYKVTSENHGEQKLPENTLEVPQCESLEEAIAFVGGDQGVVDAVNDVIRTDAKNGALAVIRNGSKDKTLEQLFEAAKSYARNFKWSTERGASKKAILEGAEKIRAAKDQLAEMSKEDLLALLESTLLK